METQYVKQYSPALDRDMECKIYGRAGRPVLYIPCQDGRFFDFENFRLTDTWAPWIESGKAMVFSIDTMDKETWSAQGDPGWRVRRHEQWMRYITDEMVPFMRAEANSRNGWTGEPGVMAFGCSLGATHAANLFSAAPTSSTGCWPSAESTPGPTALGATLMSWSTSTPWWTAWPTCPAATPISTCTTGRRAWSARARGPGSSRRLPAA